MSQKAIAKIKEIRNLGNEAALDFHLARLRVAYEGYRTELVHSDPEFQHELNSLIDGIHQHKLALAHGANNVKLSRIATAQAKKKPVAETTGLGKKNHIQATRKRKKIIG
jgi:hypothetical protein